MCGEFWCGWFDHWYEGHHVRPVEDIINCFNEFLEDGASLNYYMWHGGTNFGFTNGANHTDTQYQPTVTSYDYNAPLSEAGDRTPLYHGLRKLVEEYYGKLPEMTATETPKAEYGKLKLTETADLFDNLDNISKPIHSAALRFMEQLGQDFGYIFYRSTIDGPRNPYPLNIETVHDRAQVFINGEYKKTFERWNKEPDPDPIQIPLDYNETMKVEVLVENCGRINYGPKMGDRKGIDGLRFGAMKHFGWDIYCLPMTDLSGLDFKPVEALPWNRPTFFRGTLNIKGAPADTFVRLDGFKKGFVTVNGHNLGRYFNAAGPQKTLYVPAPFLKEGENEIIVFESDGAVCSEIYFTDTPDLG
jgi:beta-galactosidase